LTPNHFLFRQAGGSSAPESVDEIDFIPKKIKGGEELKN